MRKEIYVLDTSWNRDLSKYPKYVFNGELHILHIILLRLRVLYNRKFIVMTTSLGTIVVAIMRFQLSNNSVALFIAVSFNITSRLIIARTVL